MMYRYVTALLFTTLVALAVISFVLAAITIARDDTGPREAFEAHLRALDEERWDDANALVDITCEDYDATDAAAAGASLEELGLEFQTAFPIEQVWTNEQNTEAILELAPTAPDLSLPTTALMVKVDGDWKVSCGSPS